MRSGRSWILWPFFVVAGCTQTEPGAFQSENNNSPATGQARVLKVGETPNAADFPATISDGILPGNFTAFTLPLAPSDVGCSRRDDILVVVPLGEKRSVPRVWKLSPSISPLNLNATIAEYEKKHQLSAEVSLSPTGESTVAIHPSLQDQPPYVKPLYLKNDSGENLSDKVLPYHDPNWYRHQTFSANGRYSVWSSFKNARRMGAGYPANQNFVNQTTWYDEKTGQPDTFRPSVVNVSWMNNDASFVLGEKNERNVDNDDPKELVLAQTSDKINGLPKILYPKAGERKISRTLASVSENAEGNTLTVLTEEGEKNNRLQTIQVFSLPAFDSIRELKVNRNLDVKGIYLSRNGEHLFLFAETSGKSVVVVLSVKDGREIARPKALIGAKVSTCGENDVFVVQHELFPNGSVILDFIKLPELLKLPN